MDMSVLATGIVSDMDVMDGEPVVKGTRVRVATLHRAVEGTGLDPEVVAEKYGVSKADVHRALAYYYDNPEEMARHERIRRELKGQAIDDGAKTLGDLRREHKER
ncbi:hypothetical protein BRD01_06845 [Halobacteriales archaeon QS_8_65_32]|jgi:uncharacterized protein (DUF433 family)|nr:MAG: hypothetical protein BRD01_06845 [Halobacteriales archaeon QS_8_65_32]